MSCRIGNPRLAYALTFTTPGTYVFLCTVHADAGMAGVIRVRPR